MYPIFIYKDLAASLSMKIGSALLLRDIALWFDSLTKDALQVTNI